MKLLVSMPCYGHQMFTSATSGLITCITTGIAEGLFEKCDPHFQGDSLIHRARNRAALYAVEHGYDKLLTIDADVVWTYADFKRIVTSPEAIVGGVYPLKTFPVVLNFNPIPGRGTEFLSSERGIDYDAFAKFREKYADERGLAEVQHLPTGFLCVRREVLEKLGETSEIYEDLEAATGVRKRFMHFYSSGVHDGILESEDWSFCRRASEAGFRVMFDTGVTLGHIGLHQYRIGQFFGSASP